jgi:hypothetical protein
VSRVVDNDIGDFARRLSDLPTRLVGEDMYWLTKHVEIRRAHITDASP